MNHVVLVKNATYSLRRCKARQDKRKNGDLIHGTNRSGKGIHTGNDLQYLPGDLRLSLPVVGDG